MVGIGEVYRRYAAGDFEDDADVAQLHGPGELGFLALSEPLANIVVTFEKMAGSKVIDATELSNLIAAARKLHYKERGYERVIETAGIPAGRKDFLIAWAHAHHVDQKAIDAGLLIDWLLAAPNKRGNAAGFEFSKTSQWLQLLTEIEGVRAVA